MDRVRIGVIGVGNIARNYHLPPVHALPNAELVAVADLDESLRLRAQKQFGFRDAHTDYRRILDRDDIHAIMLLTRVNTRTEIIPATLVYTQGRKGDWIQPDLEQHPKGHLHHKIFIDDILNNTCESATPEDAVATVKIINAAYEAAQTGKTITVG